MLKIESNLYGPFICMLVMLFVPGMSSVAPLFVFMFLFTHITDRIWSWLVSRCAGKTGLKLVGVRIALKVVV